MSDRFPSTHFERTDTPDFCPVCGYMVKEPVCTKCGEPVGLAGRSLARWALMRGVRAALTGIVGGTLFIGAVIAVWAILEAL